MEWPLVVAALVFLVAYAWEVIADLQGSALVLAEVVQALTWALFLVDYGMNLYLAKPRGRWFRSHLFDLAVVVLPMLRPLRALRFVTLLRVLDRTAGYAFRGRITTYVAGAATLLVFVASLAVLDAERPAPGATIKTLGDAMWWAVVTVTTVGYGDEVPVTPQGRLIATALMFCGIALLGIVTATFAAWIVEKIAVQDAEQQAVTVSHIKDLESKIETLQEMISTLQR
jgi:voltage-gated potassium channel